jgi:hypothetical protein
VKWFASAGPLAVAFAYAALTVHSVSGVYSARLTRSQNLRFVELYEGLRKYTVSAIEPLSETVAQLRGETQKELPEVAESPEKFESEQSIGTKERNTLLAMIGVLCKDQKIDLSKPAAAAAMLKSMSDRQGVRIGETTWENKLKLVSDALAAKMR